MTTILRSKHRRLPPLPPGLRPVNVTRLTRRFFREAVQEAWAAHLAGDDPNRAVWRFVKRELVHESNARCFSQLERGTLRRIHELAEE